MTATASPSTTTTTTAAASPDRAAEAVRAWVAQHHRCEVAIAEEPRPIGDGFDTAIVATRFAGRLPPQWLGPVVLRIHPRPERLELATREAAMQGFVADRGYPAPRVLAVIGPGDALDLPVQVMERAPGTTMLDALSSKPWRARALMWRLGALHARLHSLPTEGWPGDTDPTGMARHRLQLVHRVLAERPEVAPGLARAAEVVDGLVSRVAVADPVICHGDLHPLNVMVDGDGDAVIDWTDAGLGDRHGDVARVLLLLEAAAVGAPSGLQRGALKITLPLVRRRLLAGYQAMGRPLDPARLALWAPVHLAHDWARAAGSLADGDERVQPGVVAWVERRFDQAVAALA